MPRVQLKVFIILTLGLNFAVVLQGEELCYCHEKDLNKKMARARLLEEKVSRMGRDKPENAYILKLEL